MSNQIRFRFISHCAKAQQPRMAPKFADQFRLLAGLRTFAADAGNSDQFGLAFLVELVQFFTRQLQQRPEQSDFWIANSELRCVHANRKAANSCRAVVTEQGSLTALGQFPFGVQSQWRSWYDQPALQQCTDFRVHRSRMSWTSPLLEGKTGD